MTQAGGSEPRRQRKVRVGRVVSTKMQKTVVVLLERNVPHPVYDKTVTLSKRVMVRDEKGECQVGDIVRVMETRPLSKNVHWRYVETVRKVQ